MFDVTPTEATSGHNPSTNKPYKSAQDKSYAFALTANDATHAINDLEADPKFNSASLGLTLAPTDGLAGKAANYLRSGEENQYLSQANSWIQSVLRDESGVAIPEAELQRYYKTYFPASDDGDNEIAAKQKLRKSKEDALRSKSGNGREFAEYVPAILQHQAQEEAVNRTSHETSTPTIELPEAGSVTETVTET